jgi:hypothetical protein
MNFVAALIGLVGGFWIFSENSWELAGAVTGALMGVVWLRQQRLKNRLDQLEQQLAETQPKATSSRASGQPTPTKPDPVEGDFIFELDPATQLKEKPPTARSVPSQPQAALPHTTPKIPTRTPSAKKNLQVEL